MCRYFLLSTWFLILWRDFVLWCSISYYSNIVKCKGYLSTFQGQGSSVNTRRENSQGEYRLLNPCQAGSLNNLLMPIGLYISNDWPLLQAYLILHLAWTFYTLVFNFWWYYWPYRGKIHLTSYREKWWLSTDAER